MRIRCFNGFAVAGLLAGSTFAQQTGQISGVITDSSGAVVIGASITTTETATGFARTTVTTSTGQYVLPSLRPTQYDISAEASGFRSFRRSNLELLTNQSLTLNITLEVGSVSETVNVSGAAVQVNTTTSTLAEVVDNARILEMPLNGRDVARLAALAPGAVVASVSSESGKSIPGAVRISANGSRDRSVFFRLDGATNTDTYFQENQSFPFPDAVQEFSIQTSNFSAAHGGNSGAVVNVATRSGTNDFHGGAFEFVRNRVFNARKTFNSTQDFLKRNQFGAFAGGPIRLPGYDGRNKTFFFTGWQGTRIRNQGSDLTRFAPTNAQRAGDFSAYGGILRDPLGGTFPGNRIPVGRFDPASLNVIKYISGSGRGWFDEDSAADQPFARPRSNQDRPPDHNEGPVERPVLHRSLQ